MSKIEEKKSNENEILENLNNIDLNNLNKFKNDLLEYVKIIETNLKNSLSLTTEKIYNISSNFDEKISSINEKTKLLSNLISETKFDITKFNELEKFKKSTEDKIISFDIRIQNNQKNISETNLKYDELLEDLNYHLVLYNSLLIPSFLNHSLIEQIFLIFLFHNLILLYFY
jgi:chromosome segregation ATPase